MRLQVFFGPICALYMWLLVFGAESNALSLPTQPAGLAFTGRFENQITSYAWTVYTLSWSPGEVWEAVSQHVRDYAEAQLRSKAVQSALEQINDFRAKVSDVVTHTSDFGKEVAKAVDNHNLTMDQLSDNVGLLFNETLGKLEEMFPDPKTAESHDKRQEMVSKTFDMISKQMIELFSNIGISESKVEDFIGLIRPPLENAVVLCGDLAQQHPDILEALIFLAVGLVIPESWFLRPLLSLFGFGPEGPIRGSAAAWAQSRFFGATVPKGSWFSLLQKAGMTLGRALMCCGRRK